MRVSQRFYCNILSKSKKFITGDEVSVSKTITHEDVDSFSKLSGDTNPIHLKNKEAVVHGAFLNSLVSGVIGTRLPGPGALVVEETLHFPNKCYVGETVNIKVKLVDNRKIIKVQFNCDVSDKNKTVLHGNAKLIMSKE